MKNADQVFLAGVFCLILQKSCFWLIFSIVSKLGSKTFGVSAIFYFQLLWPAKPRIIIITFINFRTLKAICVWTTTRIDLKFSEHLQGIKVYSQKYGFFYDSVFTKRYGSKLLKIGVFSVFHILVCKIYTLHSDAIKLFSKVIWTIVKTFTKFHCYDVSIEGVI